MAQESLSLSIELSGEAPAGRVIVVNRSESVIAVWNSSNQWGDTALSFEVQGGTAFQILRGPQIYTRNVPSSMRLSTGESHAWEFDLNDGSWELEDSAGLETGTMLAAVYETVASEEASTANVWVGRLVSEPVELGGAAR